VRFAELPAWLRRPLVLVHGVTFFWLVFLGLPAGAMELNEDWGWPRWQGASLRVAGATLMVLGAAAFLHCWGRFARVGRGTPVPSAPPKRIVTDGLFRYSRHPIYVAYGAFLLGEFLWFGHATLLAYVGLYFLGAQAVIVWWEEPDLRERFGEDYSRYSSRVRRWL
jgi:protein-S-isoprenylcysteine O-methyltransferase Ste14